MTMTWARLWYACVGGMGTEEVAGKGSNDLSAIDPQITQSHTEIYKRVGLPPISSYLHRSLNCLGDERLIIAFTSVSLCQL